MRPINGTNGTDGTDGTTPVITANATVDATSGTPAVSVTKSGSDAAPSFTFAFTGLKGADGQNANSGWNESHSNTLQQLMADTDINEILLNCEGLDFTKAGGFNVTWKAGQIYPSMVSREIVITGASGTGLGSFVDIGKYLYFFRDTVSNVWRMVALFDTFAPSIPTSPFTVGSDIVYEITLQVVNASVNNTYGRIEFDVSPLKYTTEMDEYGICGDCDQTVKLYCTPPSYTKMFYR